MHDYFKIHFLLYSLVWLPFLNYLYNSLYILHLSHMRLQEDKQFYIRTQKTIKQISAISANPSDRIAQPKKPLTVWLTDGDGSHRVFRFMAYYLPTKTKCRSVGFYSINSQPPSSSLTTRRRRHRRVPIAPGDDDAMERKLSKWKIYVPKHWNTRHYCAPPRTVPHYLVLRAECGFIRQSSLSVVDRVECGKSESIPHR